LEIKETSPVESSTGYSQQVFLSIFSRTEKGRARGDAVTPDKTINNPDEEEEAIRVVSPFSEMKKSHQRQNDEKIGRRRTETSS
jgi:hypothetical protein